jgi:GT2 family glycosyltransferase
MSAGLGDVTVVIPHWNRADLLEQILKHLRAQTYPITEILVVDNGSSDRSAEVASRAGARLIRLGRNRGFAPAVNRGIREARSVWVAVMNNDVTVGPEWLGVIVERAASKEAWFAVGKVFSAERDGEIDAAWDAIARSGAALRCGHGCPDGPLWSEARVSHFVPFTAVLFRRALFERVGFLDEQFESYLEDVDFGLRCAAAGLAGAYEPDAVAFHIGSATLGAWHPATVRRIARNQALIAAKHLRGGPRWPVMAGQLLWGLVAVRHARGFAYIRGKIEGLRLARGIASVTGWGKVGDILTDSEQQIRRLQQLTGFDWYWKMYFALVRR